MHWPHSAPMPEASVRENAHCAEVLRQPTNHLENVLPVYRYCTTYVPLYRVCPENNPITINTQSDYSPMRKCFTFDSRQYSTQD